ncbi:MAG: hypothetical protein Q8R38_04765 [Candidatus Omnitrophota bacterium]|nr:hypothetical protein [Candidatus Omnitrophota bacterium]
MAKIVRSIKKRRFCKLGSCKQLLSIYNFSAYCHVHQHIALAKQAAAVTHA